MEEEIKIFLEIIKKEKTEILEKLNNNKEEKKFKLIKELEKIDIILLPLIK